MRILLVEDEKALADVIRLGLEQAGYTVETVYDGASALEIGTERQFGAIVLDIMLPKLSGIQVCEELRLRRITTPILMLTARDSIKDRVKGLEVGADDYLIKPFDFSELRARVEALLRRDKLNKAQIIRVSDLEIDTKNRLVKRAGHDIALTPREYTLLEALARREGQVLTRDTILENVWLDEESLSNTVDVYIGTLRKKVDANSSVKLIHTSHGLGYMLKVLDEARV